VKRPAKPPGQAQGVREEEEILNCALVSELKLRPPEKQGESKAAELRRTREALHYTTTEKQQQTQDDNTRDGEVQNQCGGERKAARGSVATMPDAL